MNNANKVFILIIFSLFHFRITNAQKSSLPFPKVHGENFTVECECVNPEVKEKYSVGPYKAFWSVEVDGEIVHKHGYKYIGMTMAFNSYAPEFKNPPEAFIRIDSTNKIYSIANYDSTPYRKSVMPLRGLVFGDVYEERLFIDFEPYYPYYFYNQFDFDSYFFVLEDVSFDSILNEKVYTFKTIESNIWREGIAGLNKFKSSEFTVAKGYGIIQLVIQSRSDGLIFECNAPYWDDKK